MSIFSFIFIYFRSIPSKDIQFEEIPYIFPAKSISRKQVKFNG